MISIFMWAAMAVVPVQDKAQDAPPPLPPLSKPKDAGRDPAAETSTLVPGALPADTDAKARDAWERTTRGRLEGQTAVGTARVSAFDLSIDVRQRSADNQTNDSPKPWRYRFQNPGWVRVTSHSQRELVRGPNGDFLVDPERREVVRLQRLSRDDARDLQQLDESVNIARNFIALTDPSALRIARLALLATAPQGLPKAVLERSRSLALQWLDVRTPDFHLVPASGRAPVPPSSVLRVRIGADPKTGEVAMAIVDVDAGTDALSPAAVLVELASYAPINGFRMPGVIKVYETDEHSSPRAFRGEPTTMLGVHVDSANLRAQFKPEDFDPH
jgi:hypothetical protein